MLGCAAFVCASLFSETSEGQNFPSSHHVKTASVFLTGENGTFHSKGFGPAEYRILFVTYS